MNFKKKLILTLSIFIVSCSNTQISSAYNQISVNVPNQCKTQVICGKYETPAGNYNYNIQGMYNRYTKVSGSFNAKYVLMIGYLYDKNKCWKVVPIYVNKETFDSAIIGANVSISDNTVINYK